MTTQNGYYFGTEINEKWYSRYKNDLFLERGNGGYWIDNKGFHFAKFNGKTILIPLDSITNIKIGKTHAGKWVPGVTVLKIIWVKDEKKLSSGFRISFNKAETINFKNHIIKSFNIKKTT